MKISFILFTIIIMLMVSPMTLLCTWVVSSPVVTNFIARPFMNPLWGSYRLIDRFYSVPGFDIRELFNFDRIVLLLLFIMILFFSNRIQRIKFSKIDLPFLFFLGAIFISILYSNNITHRVRVAVDTFGLCYVAYFLGKNMLREDERFNKYLNAVLILGCALIAISLTEFYMHRVTFLYRITGPFLYWENLGLTLAIIFFIVLFKKNAIESGSKITARFYNLLLILLSLTIFLTYTRTIMFVVLLGLFYLSMEGKEVISKPTIKRYRIFFFFIVFLVAFSPILLQSTSFYQHRLTKRTDEGRMKTYNTAIRAFVYNPITGLGFRDFGEEQRRYIEPVEGEDPREGDLHNSYLAVAADMGLLGLIPMILLVIASYKFCRQYYLRAEGRTEKLWALTMATLTIIYFLSAMTFDLFFEPTIDNKLFYMCLGISVGRYSKLVEEKQ